MISAGSGLSTAHETERAAREAASAALRQAGADRADWGVLFATSEHRPAYDELVRIVSEELETDCVIGCTGTGVLTQQGEVEGEPGVAVLAVFSDTLRAQPFLFRDEGDGGVTAGYELASALAGSQAGSDLLVLLPDPYHLHGEKLLRALSAKIGPVPAIGAAASEDGTLSATYQFCGAEVFSASVAALRLSGQFRHSIHVTQACLPVGDPCVVTCASGNDVIALDGRPALTVLAEQMPPSLLQNAPRLLRNLFVALPPDPSDKEMKPGEYLVRNIIGYDPGRGSFSVTGSVVEGQILLFALREAETAREDLKRMLAEIEPRPTGARYSFGFYFNCAGRGRSLYRFPGIDTAYLGATLGETPIAGFFGNAEVAPLRGINRLLTYTGVLALFSD